MGAHDHTACASFGSDNHKGTARGCTRGAIIPTCLIGRYRAGSGQAVRYSHGPTHAIGHSVPVYTRPLRPLLVNQGG